MKVKKLLGFTMEFGMIVLDLLLQNIKYELKIHLMGLFIALF